jgi:hypothetical protein
MKKYLKPKNNIPSKRVSGKHPEQLKNLRNTSTPFETYNIRHRKMTCCLTAFFNNIK